MTLGSQNNSIKGFSCKNYIYSSYSICSDSIVDRCKVMISAIKQVILVTEK